MTDRIRKLVELTMAGKMYPSSTPTAYDRTDLFLSRIKRESKRLCAYIDNQSPTLNVYCAFTGLFRFDETVTGDSLRFCGHPEAKKLKADFYCKQIDNISCMEWQHASASFEKALKTGISGMIARIDESLARLAASSGICGEDVREKTEFLEGLRDLCHALIRYAHRCSAMAKDLSERVEEPAYKRNLEKLSKALLVVPENPAGSYYEVILSIYLLFSLVPDSLGTLDRYLAPYYDKEIAAGTLTREEAKEYLQELLLMPQASNIPFGDGWTKGGQSHFCVGGYTADGKDGFTDMSRLVLESMMELPTYIPQVSFRWTAKTSHEDFRTVMDLERHDAHKRIAFTNDDKRLKALTEICGLPYAKAVGYTMTGCNEIILPGSVSASTSKGNVLRCVDRMFHENAKALMAADGFEAFYRLFESAFFADLDVIYEYDDKYNLVRARDHNYVSSLLLDDCIETGLSYTQGANRYAISAPMLLGIVNVIDSLIVVDQFVYTEKTVSMEQLIAAVQANWEGFEDLHVMIAKKADYFGNDGEISRDVTKRFYHSLYTYLNGKRTIFGYPILVGDHTGYNEHFRWFGALTKATPDGRKDGDDLTFGLSQRSGRDRKGLTALLNAIASADGDGIAAGNVVSNISLDESLIKNEENFEKTVCMMETFFRNGGVQFQLNTVSREELLKAKANPDEYKNLRVRVTGYAEYFVNLRESIQEDIIKRTQITQR